MWCRTYPRHLQLMLDEMVQRVHETVAKNWLVRLPMGSPALKPIFVRAQNRLDQCHQPLVGNHRCKRPIST